MQKILGKGISISKYKNVIIFSVVIFVFSFVGRVLFLRYSMEKEKLEKEIQVVEKRKKMMEDWEILKEDYGKLSETFFKKDTLLFKKIVEESAWETKVNIKSLRTSRKSGVFCWEVLMRLNITGSYESFVIFLGLIEKKSIIIEKIIMEKGNKGVNVKLTLKGFILK